MGTVAPGMAMVFVVVLLAGADALAVDLTGTWECSERSEEFQAGVKSVQKFEYTLEVDQFGPDLNVRRGSNVFDGQVVDDAEKPDKQAQAMLILCGTDDDPTNSNSFHGFIGDAMIRQTAKVDGEKGTIKGTELQVDALVTRISIVRSKCKRIDTALPQPLIPNC